MRKNEISPPRFGEGSTLTMDQFYALNAATVGYAHASNEDLMAMSKNHPIGARFQILTLMRRILSDDAVICNYEDETGGLEKVAKDVRFMTNWLDQHNGLSDFETRLLRIMKVAEEVGEAYSAVIGATGQNPRKGVTHTWEDVRDELCDVVISALVALETLGGSWAGVLVKHSGELVRRAKQSEEKQ